MSARLPRGGAGSVKLEQFRAVNTLLGNLKTAFSGTYHAFDFVNLEIAFGHRQPEHPWNSRVYSAA